ncbi:DUF1310 family protein [Granulicatella adiacens]|uniref:DUF1310 family protein n=1 Tax=Granulicatella adiacens TaxID=46124 RepID=UPI00241FDC83|nr:DUF1310 family protein [Granulicatella adiacens]
MKKKRKKWWIIVGILLLYLAIVVISKYREKVYIREELQKPEVIAAIEKSLRSVEDNIIREPRERNGIVISDKKIRDKDTSDRGDSEYHIIKSYEIDYDKTHNNSWGLGIETSIFINGNPDLRISLLISNRESTGRFEDKNKESENYKVGSYGISREADDYLRDEEMKRPEIVALIKEELLKLDPQAFTEKGKIRSYKVNVDKMRFVENRGLDTELFINGDENLRMDFTIIKKDGKYEFGGGFTYEELDKFLKQ